MILLGLARLFTPDSLHACSRSDTNVDTLTGMANQKSANNGRQATIRLIHSSAGTPTDQIMLSDSDLF